MSKQWARQEAKTNEIASVLERGSDWVRGNQQTAAWGGAALAVAALIIGTVVHRISGEREASWSKFAIAQSYAYSRQPDQAIEQSRLLAQDHPGSTAASYGLLLAGDILFEQSKFAEAAAMYQKCADSPNHKEVLPLALANLSLAQEASAQLKEAAATGERFLETYSEHFLAPQVHAAVARSQAAQGQEAQAQATYQKMVFLYTGTYWEGWAKDRLKT